MMQHSGVVVPLYPQDYPATIPPEKQEKPIDGGRCINNVHFPTITAFLPPADKATGAGVVICPGGGYWLLAHNHEGIDIARWLNSFGVAAFMLKYRLPPDYRAPVPMHDAQRAMRLVRCRAQEWGVRPDRLGILGFSAGGHLASSVVTHFDAGKPDAPDAIDRLSCRPDFGILCYPVICFSKDYCHSGSRSQLLGEPLPADLVQFYSNELHVTPQTPPTFLFHSTDDGAVDPRNSLDFYQACLLNQVSAELHIFPHGGHGYGLGQPGTAQSQWPTLCQRWMEGLGLLKK